MVHDDRTCLITGATSGIGEASATALSRRGIRVLAVARDPRRGADAAARIRARVPDAKIDLLTAGLSLMAQVRTLAKEVRARYERVDVLMQNAAVARPRLERTSEGFEVDFATNLSPFLLTRSLTDYDFADRGRVLFGPPAREIARPRRPVRRRGLPPHADLLRREAVEHSVHHRAGAAAGRLRDHRERRRSRVRTDRSRPGRNRCVQGLPHRDATVPAQPGRATATPVHVATAPKRRARPGPTSRNDTRSNPSELARDRALAERLWTLSETRRPNRGVSSRPKYGSRESLPRHLRPRTSPSQAGSRPCHRTVQRLGLEVAARCWSPAVVDLRSSVGVLNRGALVRSVRWRPPCCRHVGESARTRPGRGSSPRG